MKLHRTGAQAANKQFLLLHGFGADHLSWAGIAPTLAKDAGVLSMDLPSHGAAPVAEIADFDALVHEATSALAAEADWQAARSRHVVGHSLGGALGIAMAARDSVLPIKSLTLIAPAGLSSALDHAWLQTFVSLDSREAATEHLSKLVDNPRMMAPLVASLLVQHLERPRIRAELTRYLEWLPALEMSAELSTLSIPIHIIWGLQDRIAPWHDALADQFDTDPLLLDDCGHLPHIEHRSEVIALINALTAD